MKILKIVFFVFVCLASGAAIYFIDGQKKELVILVEDLEQQTNTNNDLKDNEDSLVSNNAELDTQIAELKQNKSSTDKQIVTTENELSVVISDIKNGKLAQENEQTNADKIITALEDYNKAKSDISKVDKYDGQIKVLKQELAVSQEEISKSESNNKVALAINDTQELIIRLYQTANVKDDFKANVTQVIADWKVVKMNAGFSDKLVSPKTELTVVRGDRKIAEIRVSRVSANSSIAVIEKYYTVINELGEVSNAQVQIGDKVVTKQKALNEEALSVVDETATANL